MLSLEKPWGILSLKDAATGIPMKLMLKECISTAPQHADDIEPVSKQYKVISLIHLQHQHHRDRAPLWANVKDLVSGQYDRRTTFADSNGALGLIMKILTVQARRSTVRLDQLGILLYDKTLIRSFDAGHALNSTNDKLHFLLILVQALCESLDTFIEDCKSKHMQVHQLNVMTRGLQRIQERTSFLFSQPQAALQQRSAKNSIAKAQKGIQSAEAVRR